jgi:S-adenosyl-L-methionine hydrolase (adenosine-forming)
MPLLTLSSDIGMQDFMPAAIKGQIMQVDASFIPIDVTHLLSPFNYPQASYVIKNAVANFPEGTFHLILINLFDQKKDHLLVAFHKGHYYGCADNGLLTMILGEEPEAVVAIPLDNTKPKNTISYANCIAVAFSKINKGASLFDIGNAEIEIKSNKSLRPLLGSDYIEGQIIFIDNYENVVINISKAEFEEHRNGRRFSIVFKRDESIEKISESYADVSEGEKVAIFNSAGYLEIAINKGNAAGLFGLSSYSEKQQNLIKTQFAQNDLFYQTIKVYFQ